jgi:hypothetical protein
MDELTTRQSIRRLDDDAFAKTLLAALWPGRIADLLLGRNVGKVVRQGEPENLLVLRQPRYVVAPG